MKVALCYPSVWILYVSGLPTELDQIAVFACPLQAKTGTESPRASGKLSSEIIFSKVKYEGIWTEALLIRKKKKKIQSSKWQNCYILNCLLSKSPQKKWPVFLLHHAQRYFSPPSRQEGKAFSSTDSDTHCEVRITSDMKLSTACQQDFTLCPSDSSPFYPRM